MKGSSEALLQDLEHRTKQIIDWANALKSLPLAELNAREDEGRWSVLECLEHLNRYGDFYLPEIESRIESAKPSAGGVFKSTWLGEYFAKTMLPVEHMKTMKTFKSMDPMGSDLNQETLDRFIEQQHHLMRLLHNAKRVDLNKVKTGISISKWIKLRLGDTFRVVIYHNERHKAQANTVMKNTGVRTGVDELA